MQAISLGIPVVHGDWWNQSSKKESAMDLTDFKSPRFYGSSEKVRKANGDSLLFSDKSFCFGECKNKEESNLVRFVITHLGGKILQSRTNSDFIISDSTSPKNAKEDGENNNAEKVVRVTPKFILDSVEKQVLQRASDY